MSLDQHEIAARALKDNTSTSQESPTFDYQKWVHDMKRADAHRAHDNLTNFYNSTNDHSIKSAELILRTCILINGGAAVAVLAFLGSLASKGSDIFDQLMPVAESLVKFGLGVFAATVAMGASYGVHYFVGFHANSQQKIWEHPFIKDGKSSKLWGGLKIAVHWIAIALAIASVGFFVCGIYSVRDAISDLVRVSP